mmetsp:Transcript_27224/g.58497  ORF Transcript_27224/g.58497 Transcript_27224/m.58497 type:complete len:83 (-) Transcript_27224:1-249(-)
MVDMANGYRKRRLRHDGCFILARLIMEESVGIRVRKERGDDDIENPSTTAVRLDNVATNKRKKQCGEFILSASTFPWLFTIL